LKWRRYFAGEFKLWARIKDNDLVFRVMPIFTEPGEDDGWFYDLPSAFAQAGLPPPKEPWPENPPWLDAI